MESNKESLSNIINNNSATLNDTDSTFKKPQVLIGSRISKTNFRKINQNEQNIQLVEKSSTEDDCNDISVSGVQSETKEKNSQSKLGSFKTKAANLKYEEPIWSGLPEHKYVLEEVKNGQVVKSIVLSQKPFTVVGRMEDSDIVMAHPTISRYHAILQYRCIADEDAATGFYLYDLGSTHGTLLNKQRIEPKIYIKLQVGHVIKFGCSTRLFILYGPPEDRDPETELTWTELKQKYVDTTLAKEQQKIQLEKEKLEQLKKEEESGVDWGMGEDADEETDLSENPFAATQNEELYIDDPKKTLSGWFDREGEELEYIVEEKGFGHFICRVELPVEIGGLSKLTAEANMKGKKKEAVVQCALEACRLLDRHGLLRTSNQESRKRVTKDWESVDYYDSDEDNFLDRTGDVEKKRQQRMLQAGKVEVSESNVDTYETLVLKYDEYTATLRELNSRQVAINTSDKEKTDTDDEVTNYMNNLIKTAETNKIKKNIDKLLAQMERLKKLVKIARPANLPPLAPLPSESDSEKGLSNLSAKKIHPKRKCDKDLHLHKSSEEKTSRGEDEHVQENSNPVSEPEISKERLRDLEKTEPEIGKERLRDLEKTEPEIGKERLRDLETTEPEIGKERLRDLEKTEPEMGKERLRDLEKRSTRSRTRPQHQKVKKDKSTTAEDYSTLTWTPPSGQTGDGRTHLNDKLGY